MIGTPIARNVIAVSMCSGALPLVKKLHAIETRARARSFEARAASPARIATASHGARACSDTSWHACTRARRRAPTGRASPASRRLSALDPCTPASTRSKMRGTDVMLDRPHVAQIGEQIARIVADEIAHLRRADRCRSSCARRCASTAAPRARRARLRCPRSRNRAQTCASKPRLSCESMTPLGGPVVPDV